MTYTFIHTFKFILFVVLLFISFLGFTHSSHAYFTTAQKEIDLGNGTGLFLIDYSFGMTKHEVVLPITASHTNTKATNTLEFSVVDTNNESVPGKISAIVLSHANITDSGFYITKKGSSSRFTLAVFFTPDMKGVGEYRLQVTSLPFNFDGKQQLQLNPSELTYYTTKSLAL
jgi:hypothetical protein